MSNTEWVDELLAGPEAEVVRREVASLHRELAEAKERITELEHEPRITWVWVEKCTACGGNGMHGARLPDGDVDTWECDRCAGSGGEPVARVLERMAGERDDYRDQLAALKQRYDTELEASVDHAVYQHRQLSNEAMQKIRDVLLPLIDGTDDGKTPLLVTAQAVADEVARLHREHDEANATKDLHKERQQELLVENERLENLLKAAGVDPSELFVTYDGDTQWLEHFPDPDNNHDQTCSGSPLCPVEPGTRFADLLLKVAQHTCEETPE